MLRKIIIGVISIALLGLGVIYTIARQYTLDENPQKVDLIIVLGCKASNDGTVSYRQRARVDKGAELLFKGYSSKILFTGSAVANTWVEAEVMADYARTLGVKDEQVILETKSRSTKDNAFYTKEIMQKNGWTTALVVTSTLHTGRAKKIFLAQGIKADVIAASYPSDMPLLDKLKTFISELSHEMEVSRDRN